MTRKTIKSASLATLCATALGGGGAVANAQFFNGFGAATILSASLADQPSSVVIGDFDGDGDMDLAVAYAGTNSVAVFKNNSDGTFQPTPFIVNNVGLFPDGIVTGDMDGDGDLDLATSNADSDGVSVLTNNSDGTFASPVFNTLSNNLKSIAVADMDGDGDEDFVIVSSGDIIQTFLNGGFGIFSPSSTPIPIRVLSVMDVALGDLDGNGSPDAVVAFKGDATTSGGVAILLNQTVFGDLISDSTVDAVDLAFPLSN